MTQPSANLPILTVSQLTNAIKLCLEKTFPHIWLQAEISNFKCHTSGHLYFTLKDSNAQISAVMFRADAAFLKFPIKDGTQVLVRGGINVFPGHGKYQIIVKELRPVGLGELLIKFEELKNRLAQKGWFSSERKKQLPKLPKRIGVVTSPTGAAIQDILNVLSKRFSGFHLILNPVRVQGEGSAFEIAEAIRQFNQYSLADVLIVGRGGGSIEDLWAFNEEIVAEAIYNSRIPIISAVGHETDNCISDFVADMRAPTPSAAAVLVIAEKSQMVNGLFQVSNRLRQAITHQLKRHRQGLAGIIKQPVFSSPYSLLGSWMQKSDGLRIDIEAALGRYLDKKKLQMDGMQKHLHALKPTTQITQFRQEILHWEKGVRTAMLKKISALKTAAANYNRQLLNNWNSRQQGRRRLFIAAQKRRQIDQQWGRILSGQKERLDTLQANLHSIDPKNLLKKGYSILFSEKEQSVIKSVHEIKKGQKIRALLADGDVESTVLQVAPHTDRLCAFEQRGISRS